ncbi:hypothetical protein CO661_32915 [Sinorhizobium fredii]|uniref:Uncharacterized protein n=1 Tax=Rhizobium fredii TaxID=380 RepID=A0A2A6LNY6_RHIFR|nr:hypothetical protein [Sinorhizobium fredii]PDT43819.1 hypothetical protein CO661_32915 [Sinorhizobium fredii]
MRQRTKKLTDSIAMSRFAPEPRGAVRYGFAERLARMLKLCELGVLSEACQNAHSSISNNKLKRSATYSIGGKPGIDLAAMDIDVVLELPQRTKKTFNKSSRYIVGRCGIFGAFGPLIPERLILGLRVVTEQGENARDVVYPVASDNAVIERLIHHADETRFERYGPICVWQEAASHGQFNQRTNSSRFSDTNIACLRKSARDSLPKQIISILKAALNITCRLHAALANPPMLYSAKQHKPSAQATIGGTGHALDWLSDRVNQSKLMQYWRENAACATEKGPNSRVYCGRNEEGAVCNFA